MAVFLKLGILGFGGPAAHIALMEEEVVRRRKWVSKEQFLDLLSASNLIPGPNSTEMAIHLGHARAGWPGLIVAGLSFIVPATLIVMASAWAYVHFGTVVPEHVAALFYGVKPVIIAVVGQALWRLGKAALKTKELAAIAGIVLALSFLQINELILLFGSGLLLAAGRTAQRRVRSGAGLAAAVVPLIESTSQAGALTTTVGVASAAVTIAAPFGLGPLFLFFLKVGSVLFGSGYVLLAFLRADLVERFRWLSEAQLLDAVAVGQVTPGPLFTTATFIGYVLSGPTGALVATAGIFLPAFFFVAVSGPFIPRMRRSLAVGAFLDGVNAASLALMAFVSARLGLAAVVDLPTAMLAVLSAVLLVRFRINSAWLVAGGATIGLVLNQVGAGP